MLLPHQNSRNYSRSFSILVVCASEGRPSAPKRANNWSSHGATKFVPRLCSNRKSRRELHSTAEASWATTKSVGMRICFDKQNYEAVLEIFAATEIIEMFSSFEWSVTLLLIILIFSIRILKILALSEILKMLISISAYRINRYIYL